MKRTVSRVLTLLGAALLVATGILAFASRNAPVALPYVPEEAQYVVQAFADELNRGDLSALSSRIYGAPALAGEEDFDNPVLSAVWGAYVESLTWNFTGNWYASDAGICRDGVVTALDIRSALPEVESRYEALLPQRAQESRDEQVYAQDGGYHPDFVMEVLAEAAWAVLAEEPAQLRRAVTLTLVCRDGAWYIQHNGALLDVFSGSLTGKEG